MWYYDCGKEGDVVLSSRIRLARNLQQFPFPARCDENQQGEILALLKESVKNSKLRYVDLSCMADYEKQAIAEKHLISPQMMDESIKRAILLSDDNKISVLLNEEDHIRIQAMEAGFDLDSCYENANRVDDLLEESVTYAFDEKFGFLTCCPTNVGTGMRASVMMHLPALSMSGNINRIIDSLTKLGITVRGIFGEGSKATGHMYQISNQLTLGNTEEEILDQFKQVVGEVIEREREMRERLYSANKFQLQDRLMRSYGVLRHAVIMTSEEAMKRLSEVRLGVSLKLIEKVDIKTLNEITYAILPANIMKEYNLSDPKERDLKRAEIIRERMRGTCLKTD